MVMTGIPASARLGRTFVVVTVLLLAPAACGGGDPAGGDDPASTVTPTTSSSAGTNPSTTNPATTDPPTTGAGSLPPSSSQVDQAVADLAARLGVDVGAVTVVSHEGVTWPDGSIGCPQPGMGYTQALVDGTRVILEAGGETYSYHAAGMGDPFLCEDPQPPVGES